MTAPARLMPVLRYFGGKARLAEWIIAHFPHHDIYVEPYAGAASVFFAKTPAPRGETINDLDGEIVNLFRVLRGPQADELIRAVALTPWSRADLKLAHEAIDEPVERARRLVVRSRMSHGTLATAPDPTRGFRVDGTSGSTVVAREWAKMPDALEFAARRLLTATIECRPALDVMAAFSDPKVLIYLDPPYVHETRSQRVRAGQPYHRYAHEMNAEDHLALLDAAKASQAMIVLSGYATDLYDDQLRGWRRVDKQTVSHRTSSRVEALWINPLAAAALSAGPLFRQGGIAPHPAPGFIINQADSGGPQDPPNPRGKQVTRQPVPVAEPRP